MTIKAFHVPLENLDDFWPQASEYIGMALAKANDEYYIEDVYEKVKTRDLALWVGFDTEERQIVCAMTIQIQQHPRKITAMMIHFGAKHFEDVHHLLPRIEQYARENGATSLRLWGRKGWLRTLDKLGFDYEYTCMEKSV